MAPEEAAYKDATMEFLANTLGARLDRSVVDRTGLKGNYDFHVKPLPYAHYDPKAAGVELPDFAAIRDGIKELGLEVVPANADTQVLTIDHIERPSEN